jgi:hypothetical protein
VCLFGPRRRFDSEGVNTLVIQTDQRRLTIAPEIYGHFADHLGRCIYDGIWVGEARIPRISVDFARMTATAAIDRLVHHSVIQELNVPSYRAEKPQNGRAAYI